MASAVAISIRTSEAVERVLAASGNLSRALNIDPLDFPTTGKDAGILRAQQLEAVAAWLEDAVLKAPKRKKAGNGTESA